VAVYHFEITTLIDIRHILSGVRYNRVLNVDKDIVLIEWIDSKGMERWEYLDEIEPMPPCTCYSVGFIIDNHKDYKTLALGISDTQVLGRTTIPSGCIKSMKKLAISSSSYL